MSEWVGENRQRLVWWGWHSCSHQPCGNFGEFWWGDPFKYPFF